MDEFLEVEELLSDAVGILTKDSGEINCKDGFTSGVSGLDEVTGGFRRGEVAVLTGQSDSVIFDLSLKVVANILVHFLDAVAAVVQSEQFNARLLARIIALMHGLELDKNDFPTIEQFATIKKQSQLPLILNDNLPTPINEFWELVSRRKNQSGLDFLYIHDPGLILTTQGEKGKVDEVIKDLRTLARDYNIAILVSDPDLGTEDLQLRRLKLDYHFADMIMLLKSTSSQPDSGSELVVTRNRMGNTGSLFLDE